MGCHKSQTSIVCPASDGPERGMTDTPPHWGACLRPESEVGKEIVYRPCSAKVPAKKRNDGPEVKG